MAASIFQHITTFDRIKLIADSRRLSILRHLMASPASLTQLGLAIGEHPAWIRHHLVKLEQAGLVEILEIHKSAGVTEKIYRAKADALLLQEMVLPEKPGSPAIIFSGSHDLAVEILAHQLDGILNMMILPVGSLDGLVMLRQGMCQVSGCHLLDASGQYNSPFVQHIFPDRAMLLVTIADREQGLMLFPGNPKRIRSLSDLARPGTIFINRQKGSGTRLWFDQEISKLGLPTQKILGYEREVRLHTECARLVKSGEADAAVGLRAAADQRGLYFIPLLEERYDIVLPQEQMENFAPFLDSLQTNAFRRSVARLHGYNTTHTGEQIPL